MSALSLWSYLCTANGVHTEDETAPANVQQATSEEAEAAPAAPGTSARPAPPAHAEAAPDGPAKVAEHHTAEALDGVHRHIRGLMAHLHSRWVWDTMPMFNPRPPSLVPKVTIVGARGLRTAGWAGRGASARHCICEVSGKSDTRIRTAAVDDLKEALWNHEAVVLGFQKGDRLEFAVIVQHVEWRTWREVLGQATLRGTHFMFGGFEGELPLTEAGEGFEAFLKVKVEMQPHTPAPQGPTLGGHGEAASARAEERGATAAQHSEEAWAGAARERSPEEEAGDGAAQERGGAAAQGSEEAARSEAAELGAAVAIEQERGAGAAQGSEEAGAGAAQGPSGGGAVQGSEDAAHPEALEAEAAAKPAGAGANAGLPPGWEAAWNEQHGRYYYYNHDLDTSTWQLPAGSAAGEVRG
mmetsp:Transcript_40012/g.127299  ORF Transcript_40012/g.127299 Transcript_40012/m.127299 type:complete len:412 (+) Transcript_40012:155-1390(+)